jgi:hypothetical protein
MSGHVHPLAARGRLRFPGSLVGAPGVSKGVPAGSPDNRLDTAYSPLQQLLSDSPWGKTKGFFFVVSSNRMLRIVQRGGQMAGGATGSQKRPRPALRYLGGGGAETFRGLLGLSAV